MNTNAAYDEKTTQKIYLFLVISFTVFNILGIIIDRWGIVGQGSVRQEILAEQMNRLDSRTTAKEQISKLDARITLLEIDVKGMSASLARIEERTASMMRELEQMSKRIQ